MFLENLKKRIGGGCVYIQMCLMEIELLITLK